MSKSVLKRILWPECCISISIKRGCFFRGGQSLWSLPDGSHPALRLHQWCFARSQAGLVGGRDPRKRKCGRWGWGGEMSFGGPFLRFYMILNDFTPYLEADGCNLVEVERREISTVFFEENTFAARAFNVLTIFTQLYVLYRSLQHMDMYTFIHL